MVEETTMVRISLPVQKQLKAIAVHETRSMSGELEFLIKERYAALFGNQLPGTLVDILAGDVDGGAE